MNCFELTFDSNEIFVKLLIYTDKLTLKTYPIIGSCKDIAAELILLALARAL